MSGPRRSTSIQPGTSPKGRTIWDSDRLGAQTDFVEMLADHGLKLSLHLMMHTTKLDEDPRFYLRDRDGNLMSFMNHREVIYPNVCVCCASAVWKQTKIERLRALADAGATFMMFDFLNYGRGVGSRRWRGAMTPHMAIRCR